MRFSLQPEQRPEQRMQTVSIDEILTGVGKESDKRPPLESYFSPTRKEVFTKDFLHYLNTELLEARHGKMDLDLYLVFVLTFQFISPLLEINTEKEMGLFIRILGKTYEIEDPDLNLHFGLDGAKGEDREMLGEKAALEAFRQELDETYVGTREVKESVQKRLKTDGIEAIMSWQHEQSLKNLASAFGKSIVVPSFFSFSDKKLIGFYRENTQGISYQVAVPDRLEHTTTDNI
jgi:hypothetical protein